MGMVAFAIYDRDTGEVVQVHVEPADLDSSLEEIVQLAAIRASGRLRAIRINADDMPREAARVVDGELRVGDGAGENWGYAEVDAPGEIVESRIERQYVVEPRTGMSE